MNNILWDAVLHCDPFAKEEDILEIRELNNWDILIVFKDGRRLLYDSFTKFHKNIGYNNINELSDDYEKKEFAYMLRSMMGRKGITQEEMANQVGTSQVMISRYMRGETIPNAIMLRKIAKVLGCSMDDFFPKNFY